MAIEKNRKPAIIILSVRAVLDVSRSENLPCLNNRPTTSSEKKKKYISTAIETKTTNLNSRVMALINSVFFSLDRSGKELWVMAMEKTANGN